jgi:hypothetical protein
MKKCVMFAWEAENVIIATVPGIQKQAVVPFAGETAFVLTAMGQEE